MSLSDRLTGVDRLAEGLILSFSDGSSGFFSSSLLYEMIAFAQHLDDADTMGLDSRIMFRCKTS